MNSEDAIKWLDNLRNDLGNPHYERLWVYAQAIDEIAELIEKQSKTITELKISRLNELEEERNSLIHEMQQHGAQFAVLGNMESEAWVVISKAKNKGTECVLGIHPIVLCKDCKHHNRASCPLSDDYWETMRDDDWFCADGEMKEGE